MDDGFPPLWEDDNFPTAPSGEIPDRENVSSRAAANRQQNSQGERQRTTGAVQRQEVKLRRVLATMNSEGFNSLRQFLVALFSNPNLKEVQSGFYGRNVHAGFNEVLEIWLANPQGGQCKKKDPPNSLINWLYDRCDREMEDLLSDSSSILRGTATRETGHVEKLADHDDFSQYLIKHAPITQKLFYRLGLNRVERLDKESDSENNIEWSLISTNALLSLLYSRNQQANAWQVGFYFPACPEHSIIDIIP
jgi:hypothetical protein